jgi:malate/lactate dehydrogenase
MDLVINIVGFGNIGKLICALLLTKQEHRFSINIVDINPNVTGAILDLQQGSQLFSNHKITHNSKEHFTNADFIFHCAGASVPKGDSRLSTCLKSIEITEAIFRDFKPNKVFLLSLLQIQLISSQLSRIK